MIRETDAAARTTTRDGLRRIEATHTLTLGISDGRFEDTETVTITVPPPGVSTSLRGQVVTVNNAPLAGVRLEMLGVEDRSDANGEFRLGGLPAAGVKRLLIDGSTVNPGLGTFATVPEIIEVIAGADNVVEPEIVLLPLDVASADPIDLFVTSTITSRAVVIDGETFAPVTLTVPARTATLEATGALYQGLVHISRIPDPALGPRPLPDDLDLSIYIAMQPFGVRYDPPAPISFPNVEHFPPGKTLDIFGLNHDTGVVEKLGEGLESADGRTVDSVG
ncbi:MAG: hypothetical protein ACT4QB_20215, partial [Gammaproteobacteria bacterium]